MLRKYFSPFILVFSILILIFVIFKAEIVNDGTKFYYYKYYYYISIIFILFSLLSFLFSEKIKQYLIIIGISTLCTFYSYEFYLSFNAYKEITEISRITIYEQEKAKNTNLVTITVSPGNFLKDELDVFPLSGMSNALTIHCDENGYMSKYISDRYGFNNPDDEWNKKKIKFFVTGDSFAAGACVNRPDDITSVLRKKTRSGSIQVGYGGNGPLIEYAALREYINPLMNIENIIWLFFEGNDIEALNYELENKILKKYIIDLNFTQDLKNRQNVVDEIIKKYISDKRYNEAEIDRTNELSLRNKIKLFFKLYYLRNSIIKPKVNNDFKKIIILTKELASKKGGNFHFVYLPAIERYTSLYYDNSNYNKIKKMMNDLNINFIDVKKDIFSKEEDPVFLFSKYGHYTATGYAKIVDLILKNTE